MKGKTMTDTDIVETSTDLIQPANLDLPSLFADGTPSKLDPVIRSIEERCRSEVFDMTDDQSREACRSLAYKIARSKTALEGAGKKLSDELRARIKPINDLRTMVEARLDKLRLEVRKPLTEWEDAEKRRLDETNAKLEGLRMIADSIQGQSVQACEDMLERLKTMEEPESDIFGDFTEIAADLYRNAVSATERALDAAKAADAERAELEQLRREKAEREAAAASEQAEKERAEREAKEAADREAREKRIAEEAAERTRQEERDRYAKQTAAAEAKRAAEEAEAERRAANKRHRAKIRSEVIAAVREYLTGTGADVKIADDIVDAIIEGKVPHVSIAF